MAIEVEIDGKKVLLSDKERKKLNNRKIKPLKKKIKSGQLYKGVYIFFLGNRSDNFPLYDGKIIKELGDNKFEINVICRALGTSREPQIMIKTGKELNIDKKRV